MFSICRLITVKLHLSRHLASDFKAFSACLLVLFLAWWAGLANAEEWRLVARNSNASQYVDLHSIMSAVKAVEYWDKLQFARPQAIGNGKMIQEIRSLSIADCTNRTIAGEFYAIYDTQEKLIDIYQVPRTFKEVGKNTKATAVLKYVCRQKPDPAKLAQRKGGAAAILAELATPPSTNDHVVTPGMIGHGGRSGNGKRYAAYIAQEARATHVDPALVRAIMTAESGNNPYAVSPKGALGLMQLLPATARRFGVSQLFDPAENIKAGVKYLSYLLKLFHNDVALAVAAYNAGENAVIKYGNHVPPYKETLQYVPKVLKLYNSFR